MSPNYKTFEERIHQNPTKFSWRFPVIGLSFTLPLLVQSNMDPDPLVRGARLDPDPSIIKLLCDYLFLKNDVNVPSKSNKQKKLEKMVFCWRLMSNAIR
jgi:hypothetical protein